jgi:hypothetical protein
MYRKNPRFILRTPMTLRVPEHRLLRFRLVERMPAAAGGATEIEHMSAAEDLARDAAALL